MDFKSMSDHELLLIINLKSDIKYTHDQLQEARQVYIERMYSRTVSAMNTSSALKTESAEPVQTKKAPPTAFDFMLPEEPAKKPVSAETVILPVVPPHEEASEPEQLVMPELSEDTPDTQPSDDIPDTQHEEKPEAQSYTYIHSDDSDYHHTLLSEHTAPVKSENLFLTFLHGIFAYLLMPVIMIKELCVFASSMVLLVTSFKSTMYHICTVTGFVYMIFILFVWYFVLNRRATAACKILVFAEIFRTASELMMMQSFFGNTVSIIYITLLLLASFSIRKRR